MRIIPDISTTVRTSSTSPTIWVAKDQELEHLIELKRRFSECPFVYSLEMAPYKEKKHDMSEFGQIIEERSAFSINNCLSQDFHDTKNQPEQGGSEYSW